MDRFKPINDTYGHALGDEVLKAVARRLRRALSDADFVARLGGDEFLVLLRGVNQRAQADAVATRLQATLCRPIGVSDVTVQVGTSIGVALSGLNGDRAEDVLQAADQAMYERKRLAHGAAGDSGAHHERTSA